MKELIDFLLANGAHAAAIIKVADITFREEFRKNCEMNSCGKYNTNWACPPACGEISTLIAEAQGYQDALVFQCVGRLEDSFDYEGMQTAKAEFARVAELLFGEFPKHHDGKHLRLTAGACKLCPRCAKLDELPCRYPERMTPSMEAYGTDVTALAKAAGMNYINGQNTVTYFGAVLYN